jgi:hypothetical protein
MAELKLGDGLPIATPDGLRGPLLNRGGGGRFDAMWYAHQMAIDPAALKAGTADIGPVLQAAIDDLPANGGELVLEAPTVRYRLLTPVTVNKTVSIRASHARGAVSTTENGVRIRAEAPMDGMFVVQGLGAAGDGTQHGDLRFYGLLLDGGALQGANALDGIRFVGQQPLTEIERCSFLWFRPGGAAIRFLGEEGQVHAWVGTVRRCSFGATWGSGIIANRGADSQVIEHCMFGIPPMGEYAIDWLGDHGAAHLIIRDNNTGGLGSKGIRIRNQQQCKIYHNQLEHYGVMDNPDNAMIRLTGGLDGQINEIFGNNLLCQEVETAIYCDDVRDNYIYRNSINAQTHAVKLSSNAKRIHVGDNQYGYHMTQPILDAGRQVRYTGEMLLGEYRSDAVPDTGAATHLPLVGGLTWQVIEDDVRVTRIVVTTGGAGFPASPGALAITPERQFAGLPAFGAVVQQGGGTYDHLHEWRPHGFVINRGQYLRVVAENTDTGAGPRTLLVRVYGQRRNPNEAG